VSPLELVDDRFEQLAGELRAAKPVAPIELRERVESLTPPPRRRPAFPLRRLVPVVGLAALAGSLGVAALIGVVNSGSEDVSNHGALQAQVSTTEAFGQSAVHGANPRAASPYDSTQRALPPAQRRLQQYDSSLTLRVQDADRLSARTQQAMRVTRSLGGYVASASFDVPGRQGTSILVLRIPIARVQRALAAFAGYGTLLSQKISVQDLQRRADAQISHVAALRRGVAVLEAQLQTSITSAERMRLERGLSIEKSRLAAQEKRLRATVRRAELASVALTLVTPPVNASAAPGRFDRTLDDAGSVLARELEILLYALIVVGPLLVLGGIAVALGRAQRRRSDRRLLERSA
jgi:hypothetical protein